MCTLSGEFQVLTVRRAGFRSRPSDDPLTNSSAFSPTDTMPLTSRAKLLMGTQSTMALITSVVVIAKGVGSLK